MIYLFYFLICAAATTMGAIAGIGGGVIIKPVMDTLGGMDVSAISFLSGCTVLAMSVVSLQRSRNNGTRIDSKQGTLLACGGALGGVTGKWIFDIVKSSFGNDGFIGTAQSVFMVLLTAGVLVYVLKKEAIRTKRLSHPLVCLGIGLMLGLLSSFLGIGGGPVNLAVLYYFFSMDTKTAALNSIYIILFSQIASFATTVLRGRVPDFQWMVLICMVLGGISGGFLGQAFNKKMSNRQVDLLFRFVLVLILAISCFNVLKYAAML